ncbi:HAMP domain-containing sensor histidine kinase [Herpetosiphon gulosus]|uniref:histidine kinase n=1 Tax=Herpetosiphon gulosus TaxID=1973496 RepID=A0ABP9X332_9CHLR
MSRASSFERATLDPFYHELRTSLTLIQTCTDLLMHADQIGQADLRNFLQIIRRGGTRIDRLVRDYILLAKGEYGVLSEEKVAQPTSVLPPLNLALLEVRAESNDRGVEIVSDLPETMPLVLANPDHLRLIIERLLSVALRFVRNSGDAVVVQTRTMPDSVAVVFTVEGVPLTDEDLPRIFDRFFVPQNLPLSREQHGLGLDLPVVKSLVELYAGKVAIERLAKGNVFAFTIPRAEPETSRS